MQIVVKNGQKSFGGNVLFKNINLSFETGNVYYIKGENGSGKTVFLKTLCGYIALDKGFIMQDKKIIRKRNNYIEDAGIIIETPKFLDHLSLIDNLGLLKCMSNKITDERINHWISLYHIDKFKYTKYKHCSLGTKQKLLLIQAFIHKPSVLILDEPFNALDAESMAVTQEYLTRIENNVIIILTSHINQSIGYSADYEYVLRNQTLESII